MDSETVFESNKSNNDKGMQCKGNYTLFLTQIDNDADYCLLEPGELRSRCRRSKYIEVG